MNAVALLHPSLPESTIEPFQKINPALQIRTDLSEAEELNAALVLGGDGTIHRYLSPLHKFRIPVLVVPKGSGNDFAKALGIKNEKVALEAWQKYCSGVGNVRTIDLGLIRSSEGETLFCCVAGAGLDAAANALANAMPSWLRGHGGYLVAALQALASFKTTKITATWDEGKIARPAFLIAVGNANRYAGGMKLTAQAQLDDGLLDICLVGEMSRLKILCWMPTVFFGGHLRLKEVEYFRSRMIRIETDRPLDVYADGEYACRTPAVINLLPQALRVIVPA